MPYAPRTSGPCSDLARSLMVCAYCLGDLTPQSDLLGGDLTCRHCRHTITDSTRRVVDAAPKITHLILRQPVPGQPAVPAAIARSA